MRVELRWWMAGQFWVGNRAIRDPWLLRRDWERGAEQTKESMTRGNKQARTPGEAGSSDETERGRRLGRTRG